MPSRIAVDRDLTDDERLLIDWLLTHADGDNAVFVEQLHRARVIARCTCGCASVDLAIEGRSSTGSMGILADFQWTTPEGHFCGALVFEQGGLLSGLDLWSIDGETVPRTLPSIKDLVPFGTLRT